MAVNLNLNEKRILLTRITLNAKTKSGLILGEITSREDDSSAYGIVEASAEGNKYTVGTIVSFNPKVTMKVNWKGKYYELMRENDVFFGVPEEEKETLEVLNFDASEGKEEAYKNPGNFETSFASSALSKATRSNPNAFYVGG